MQRLQEAESQRRESNLSPVAFAVDWWARVQKGMSAEDAGCLAAAVEPIFLEFPHWGTSTQQERDLRRALYKKLNEVGVQDMVAWADEILTLFRRVAR